MIVDVFLHGRLMHLRNALSPKAQILIRPRVAVWKIMQLLRIVCDRISCVVSAKITVFWEINPVSNIFKPPKCDL